MTPVAGILLGAAGATVGSFAVNATRRMQAEQPWAAGRSRCERCGKSLSYAETLPVVSYLRLGGRCAGCGEAIAPIHVIGEVSGAVLLPLCLATGGPIAGLAGFGLAMAAIAVTSYGRVGT